MGAAALRRVLERVARMGGDLRQVVLPIAIIVMFLGGCTSTPPRYQVLEYDGGMVIGDLQRGPARFTVVSIERLDSAMARATTIRLFDGVPVSLAQATPEFLLGRGRVFVARAGAEEGRDGRGGPAVPLGAGPDADQRAFVELRGLGSFDPDRVYFVIVGPPPNGPFYRFDVVGGRAVRFGTQWPGGLLEDGMTILPGAVFLDARGEDHEMPLTRSDVEAIWGAPARVLLVRPPGA